MANILAILVAVVAFSCAADARQDSQGRPSVAYQWSAISKLDRSVHNIYNTYFFVDTNSQTLNWNVEYLQDMPHIKMDLQVMRQNEMGEWEMMHRIKNAPLCSKADSREAKIVSAYAVLLGLQNSSPRVYPNRPRSQRSQSQKAMSLEAQSQESQSQQSQSQEAMQQNAQSQESQGGQSQDNHSQNSIDSGTRVCHVMKGIVNLKNFSPKPHQISPMLKTGMQMVHFNLKRNGKTFANVDFMVDVRL